MSPPEREPEVPGSPVATLVCADYIAATLACSPRHVRRLSDSGRMPAPLKVGALVRWRREDIDQWIADDCPRCGRGDQQRRQQ
jgi:excisionase family DNA binding protein